MVGECKPIKLRVSICGIARVKIAGMMAKYLAISLAILKVVSAPRRHQELLADSATSIILEGSESRSTMLATSLAATVPLFMAKPTSA